TSRAFDTVVGEMTPYLQKVIQWQLYFRHGFFRACSFVLGLTLPHIVFLVEPETEGVPREEIDAVRLGHSSFGSTRG
ncbi:hypothetical protein C8R43DRAFT_872507, partial [Mycena crocata]